MEKGKINMKDIKKQSEWTQSRTLFYIGLFAAILVFIGDWMLGYGVKQANLSGLEGKLSTYMGKTDSVYLCSALFGLIGIVLEGLSYFGIYRLVKKESLKYARKLRIGIIGYLAFGACGVHVPCVMAAWLYSFLRTENPGIAYECVRKFAVYFMVPAIILFTIFCLYLIVVQIYIFAKGMTPYPKWCWVFNIGVGMAVTMAIATPFRGYAWGNALAAAWISVGNIWQFLGLLLIMNRLQKQRLEYNEK